MYLVLDIINQVLCARTCLKQILFSSGEACNKPGSKVPYQNGGFIVSGLPDNTPHKKPHNYGVDQIKLIMEQQQNIVFQLSQAITLESREKRQSALELFVRCYQRLLTKAKCRVS